MEMARSNSALAYPDRFYAAASYAGFDGSPGTADKTVTSKFKSDVALLLYGLYQQATVGPCNTPKPRIWSPIEQSKWQSWNGLGNMASTEAMRLFVKILEEEDPGWYSRAANFDSEPVIDVQMNHNSKVTTVKENGHTEASPETKTISTENGNLEETQDKDVVSEGVGSVGVYDQWVPSQVSGQRPKPRYEHGAAIIQNKMYVYGGNHNGRYLGDLQVLDLRSWTWSKVDTKAAFESQESSQRPVPCAGHTLVPWENKLLSVGGHLKQSSEDLQVRVFDLQTQTWSILKTYGKPPASRGGQSVTFMGNSLVIFGGQTANRTLLNDLHLLDLETMTWDEIETLGVAPTPRSDHAAAVHAERYLLIFGGGSHATCFSDLHVLDLQTMEWSRPTPQGDIPAPRAGHAGATIGENWFIVGGGDNKSGAPETVVLNMSTLVWSVVTSVQGRVPVASEGLSLVVSSYNGEDVLVSFGGYNGHYNNEVHVLKPSHKSSLTTRDLEPELDDHQDGKIREITVDNDAEKIKGELSSEDVIATLKTQKEEAESALNKEKSHSQQLKQELNEAETRNTELYKELQSVRGQLATEQSRCFKLEVDVAELRQKLQTLDTLQKELELLQRQKAASEEAALSSKQRQGSGGVWGWLAPAPKSDDA